MLLPFCLKFHDQACFVAKHEARMCQFSNHTHCIRCDSSLYLSSQAPTPCDRYCQCDNVLYVKKKKVRVAILTFDNIILLIIYEVINPRLFLSYQELYHPPIRQQPQLRLIVSASPVYRTCHQLHP